MAGRNYLAFDLGAESGRAVLGTLNAGGAGKLTLEEKHRFPNPISALVPLSAVAVTAWPPSASRQQRQGPLPPHSLEPSPRGSAPGGVLNVASLIHIPIFHAVLHPVSCPSAGRRTGHGGRRQPDRAPHWHTVPKPVLTPAS